MGLRLENLSKSFNKKQIFSDFSYVFSDTGAYAVLGDSGVGKTTLLRIISGLDSDFSGTVTGGGIANVSFAFQEYRLFPGLTAIENVLTASKIGSEGDFEKARSFLSELGFSYEEMQLLPAELSGGMKQRVSLARAFLKKAPILLLDEPTKELDDGLCKTVRNMIAREAKTRLVIMVTHRIEDIHAIGATEISL